MAGQLAVKNSGETSFYRKKGELTSLLKSLTKVSEDAIEVLVEGLKSDDEKVRVSCADKLLTFQVSTAKAVNDDNLQRLILEIKLAKGGGPRELADEQKPTFCFDVVQEVN